MRFADRQRIGRKRVLLYGIDIGGKPLRHRVDQRDADDADAAGKRGQQRAAFFGEQVFQRETKRRHKRHRRFLFFFGFGSECGVLFAIGLHFSIRKRSAVGSDHAVEHPDDTGRVGFGDVGVMRNHDNQAVFGDLFEDIHDLYARFGVQRAGRFVGEDDIGVIDECTGDRYALHLTAGHFRRFLRKLIAQSDVLERFFGAGTAFGLGDARQRQRQFDVLQDGLMRDQVIALEDEADRMVAVGIPVAVFVILGRAAIDHKVAFGVLVETTNDVEHRGFTAAGGTEDRDKFVFPKLQIDPLEGMDGSVASGVVLFDLFEF